MKKLFLLLAFLIPTASFATTTYYVDAALGSDSNSGTSPGSGNAWATIKKALISVSQGDLVYVKASAVYSSTTSLVAAVGAGSVTFGSQTRIVGYTSSPGDLGRSTIQTSSAAIGINVTGSGWSFENFVLDGLSTGTVGVNLAGSTFSNLFTNMKIQNWTAEGFLDNNCESFSLLNSEVTNVNGAAAVKINSQLAATVMGCKIHDNTVTGISAVSTTGNNIIRNLIYKNSGATSDGIFINNYVPTVIGNTIDNNGRDGVHMANLFVMGTIVNNIVTRNGAYGINASAMSTAAGATTIDYNWFGTGAWANTTGDRNVYLAGPHELTGDPQYTNPSGGDFTPLNSAVQAAVPSGWIGSVAPTSAASAVTTASPFLQ